MIGTENIRRHPDGSIDFDFYRADARALRRQAMRDAIAPRRVSVGALATAVGFLCAFLLSHLIGE